MSVFMQDLKLECKRIQTSTHYTWKVWLYALSAFKAGFFFFFSFLKCKDAPFGLESSICAWDGNPEHNPGPLQSHRISKDNSEN